MPGTSKSGETSPSLSAGLIQPSDGQIVIGTQERPQYRVDSDVTQNRADGARIRAAEDVVVADIDYVERLMQEPSLMNAVTDFPASPKVVHQRLHRHR